MAIISIDFDGTCVGQAFPGIGTDIGAVPVLRRLCDAGHRLILNTMRCGDYLDAAVDWFRVNGIPLWGVNCNPEQASWQTSRKIWADVIIDDTAVGVPCKVDDRGLRYVDWGLLDLMLTDDYLRGFQVPWVDVDDLRL